MQRGNNRRRLFSYAPDYRYLLRILAKETRAHDVLVHAACLMANHLHLLLTAPSQEALSDCVKKYGQRYAQHRNKRRDGSGKLFEERFKSEPITSDEQLIATTLYIDRNPVAAGLKDSPAEYPWSTFRLHANLDGSKLPSGLWTPSLWYEQLGGTREQRAEAFLRAYDRYDASKLSARQRSLIERTDRASLPYTRRLRRPDGQRASEATTGYFTGARK